MKKISFILMLLFSLVAMQMQAATTHCFWGYCNSKVSGEFGSKTKAKGAIYIPADIAQLYKGKTISFVKVGLAAMANSVNVFITKDLNGTSITTKKAGMLYNGWNEVKLSSPYTIDGEASVMKAITLPWDARKCIRKTVAGPTWETVGKTMQLKRSTKRLH